MTKHPNPLTALPATTPGHPRPGPLPGRPGPDQRLVVVLRAVPDTVARALTTTGFAELTADDTKVIYAPTGAATTDDAGEPEPPPVHKALYTPVEAAAQLSVGRSTVYELLATGQLESIRIGRCRRIPAASIRRYVEQLTSLSRAGGTIDPYRSSGHAQDAAVETGNTDGRVSMARSAQQGTGGAR